MGVVAEKKIDAIQVIASSIRAYNKRVKGNVDRGTDIMISVADNRNPLVIHDVFLTQDQAVDFIEKLSLQIASNDTKEEE